MQKMKAKLNFGLILFLMALCVCLIVAMSENISLRAYAEESDPFDNLIINKPQSDYNGLIKNVTFTLDGQNIVPTQINYTLIECEEEGAVYNSETAPIEAGIYQVSFSLYTAYGIHNGTTDLQINRINVPIRAFTKASASITYSEFEDFEAEVSSNIDGFYQKMTLNYNFSDVTNSQPHVGNYIATASFAGSRNYLPTSIEQSFEVRPKTILVSLSQEVAKAYNGRNQEKNFEYDKNEFPENEGYIYLTYNDSLTAKDVDDYEIEVICSNANYVANIVSGLPQFKITKVDLEIKLNDITILYGETPYFSFRYEGFVENENAEYLNPYPMVENVPTEIGVYEIEASGAGSNNYNIIYYPATLTINMVQIKLGVSGSNSRATLDGSFLPQTSLLFTQLTNDDFEFGGVYQIVDGSIGLTSVSDIDYIYQMRFKEGGALAGTTFRVTLTNIKLSPFFKYKVGVVNADGEYYSAKYSYKNGSLVFDTKVDGHVVISKNVIPTYIVISIFGFVVLMIILFRIAAHINYLKMKNNNKKSKHINKSPKN